LFDPQNTMKAILILALIAVAYGALECPEACIVRSPLNFTSWGSADCAGENITEEFYCPGACVGYEGDVAYTEFCGHDGSVYSLAYDSEICDGGVTAYYEAIVNECKNYEDQDYSEKWTVCEPDDRYFLKYICNSSDCDQCEEPVEIQQGACDSFVENMTARYFLDCMTAQVYVFAYSESECAIANANPNVVKAAVGECLPYGDLFFKLDSREPTVAPETTTTLEPTTTSGASRLSLF